MKCRFSSVAFSAVLLSSSLLSQAADNPYLGEWELTIPGGAAGWLGVQENSGQLQASIMWGAGSVEPVASAKLDGGRLVLTRKHEVERKDSQGKKTKVTLTETITATLDGNTLRLATTKPRDNGQGEETAEFRGRRQPPMPPAPDLSR